MGWGGGGSNCQVGCGGRVYGSCGGKWFRIRHGRVRHGGRSKSENGIDISDTYRFYTE